MIHRILFSAAFLALLAHSDPVDVEIFMRCDPSIATWWGNLTIVEHDYGHSELFKTVSFTTNELGQWFKFEGFYPGWDLGFNFEIGYQLIHNCTINGQLKCIQPRPTPISQFGHQKVEFYVRAFENGDKYCHRMDLE